MEVQTRDRQGQLEYFSTLKEAYEHAQKNPDVWKISFPLATGERVRLVKMSNDWVWQDIVREVEDTLKMG